MRIAHSACLVAALSVTAAAQAWLMPAHFQAVPLPGTFTLPVNIVFTPDGSIFVVEKPGTVRLLDPAGTQQAAPFIDLVAEVNNDWDRGLLGLALHPGWVPDGGPASWVYLLYTVSPVPPADNGFATGQKYSFSRLTRYRAITSGGSVVADLASRQILLGHQNADGSVPDCIASVHNSHSNGRLCFAPDGTLLLTTGDGAHYDFKDTGTHDAPGFDNWTHPATGKKGPTPAVQDEGALRSQDLRSLSGKVLRLDPETGNGLPSNPFWNGDPAANPSRIWALGLRNPFRMARVPGTGAANPALGQPGVLLIGDVGWNTWEEIDLARVGGENFGWPCWEGFPMQSGYQQYQTSNPEKFDCHDTLPGVHTDPVLAWNHGGANLLAPAGLYKDENGVPLGGFAGNCSIGGALYAGSTYPSKYAGRLFFADYVRAVVKTIEFDAAWNATAVRDFASDIGSVVDICPSPLNGDLYTADVTSGRLWHITYGANLAPVAVASASVTHGPGPLAVDFTGSASHDPDAGDVLSFDWDYGDGTPHGTAANVSHTFLADGLFEVRLVVTDPLGLASEAIVQVAVGNGPPFVAIAQPAMAQTYSVPTTLHLSGSALDPDGDSLQLAWSVDLFHLTHMHPAVAGFAGPTADFEITTSREDDELLYYRITLTATDPGGLSGSAHVFVYPSERVADVAGSARPISRMDELSPATPTGGGNHDIEVARDAVFPAVGSGNSAVQFDTYHGGQQGLDDWIGFELLAPPPDEFRFTGLAFQEGMHFVDGGWWKDLRVEVRNAGVWSIASNLHVTPAYPFALSGQQFFDGVGFQTYQLDFDAAFGDAVRLRGTPGGSAHFMSVGELRCRAVQAPAPTPWRDITAQAASVLSKVDGLVPAGPFGGAGNKDKETLRNGTFAPPGSVSWIAEYDTFHNGDQGSSDWIGYDFGATRTIGRLLYQEGRNDPAGGAFELLNVQVQTTANGPWTTVAGVTCTPTYPGLNAAHYESFDLQFAPKLARGVRLQGDPAGTSSYVSAGELRVFEPALAAGCGWESYGPGPLGANTLQLSSDTPPGLGLPIELRATGAAGAANGLLVTSFAPASLPLHGGTLLVDPALMLMLPLGFDATGTLTLLGLLPTDPGLEGVSAWLQAAAFNQPAPWPTRFSSGLKLTLCAP